MRETRFMQEATRTAMRHRAEELAHSGEHPDHFSIEEQLRDEFGIGIDPHFIFSSPEEKTRFDQMCRTAQRRKSDVQAS